MPGPGKKMGGMSLYADLLGSKQKAEQGATISGAPVKYNVAKLEGEEGGEAGAKKKDASLQFQPIRRPQVPPKINRPKQQQATSSSAHKFSSSTVTASSPDKQASTTTSSTPQQQPNVQRTKLEDWVGDEDDDAYFYQDNRPKHERGGRKKKKKGKLQQETRVWDWDDIYDPTLPNNYADYKGSEEQYREIRDWKARLYYHQLKEAKKEGRNGMGAAYSDEEEPAGRPANRMFAPPPNLSFAPPSFDDGPSRPPPVDDDDDYYPPSVPNYPPDTSDSYEPPPAFAHASLSHDPTGDDAYLRRMHMTGATPAQPSFPPPPPHQAPPPPMPAPTPAAQPVVGGDEVPADIAAKKAEAAAKIAAFKAKIANKSNAGNGAAALPPPPPAPPNAPQVTPAQPAISSPAQMAPPPPPAEEPGISLSRAPVRYQLPSAPSDLPPTQEVPEPEARSTRPGQKGFAERLLKKYGWEKGQGLGAQGEGITTAIVAKAEKRKKRSDAQGGGWAQPANMGKLVGGKKRRKIDNTAQDDGLFGAMSEVVKLEGMCRGMDIDAEIAEGDLYGEIGGEMEREYGSVERIFIWRVEEGGSDDVFVKFTSQLSALRAVNATDGMEFNGNAVKARFFLAEKFERQEYD